MGSNARGEVEKQGSRLSKIKKSEGLRVKKRDSHLALQEGVTTKCKNVIQPRKKQWDDGCSSEMGAFHRHVGSM